MNRRGIRRRDVLRTGAALAAAGSVCPAFSILRAGESPNEKLNVGLLGVGARGVHTYSQMFGSESLQKHLNYVCFCDPNENSRQILYDNPGRAKYARDFDKRFGHLPYHRDFRKLLDRHDREIDAVIVSATYSANFAAARWAIEMGKHAYTEKPTGITVEEARMMPEIVRRTKRVTQMGNIGFTGKGPMTFRNWVEGGVFGDIRQMHIAIGSSRHCLKHLPAEGPGLPVPETFDWDVFLGVVPKRPFPGMKWVEGQGAWAPVVGLGTSHIGNWGTHCCTGDVWALKLKNPTSIKLVELAPVDEFCYNAIVEYKFPKRDGLAPLTLRIYLGDDDFRRTRVPLPDPMEPERKQNMRYFNLHVIYGDRAAATCGHYNGGLRIAPESKMREMMPELRAVEEKYEAPWLGRFSHMMHWIDACRRGDPFAPLANWHDTAGPLMEFLNISHVVMRHGQVGKELRWDGENMQFTNDDEATGLLSRPYRKEYVNWT